MLKENKKRQGRVRYSLTEQGSFGECTYMAVATQQSKKLALFVPGRTRPCSFLRAPRVEGPNCQRPLRRLTDVVSVSARRGGQCDDLHGRTLHQP